MAGRGGRRRGGYVPAWRSRPPWGLIVLVLLVGVALVRGGAEDSGPPQPAAGSAPAPGAGGPTAAPAPSVRPLPPSRPERVLVPAIRVDAPLVPLGLGADGWIDAPPPEERNLAGWYQGAVTPGESGTAVLVGHVDNASGRAVFYDLGALRKGNRVEVRRADGRTASFAIYGVEVLGKRSFPADRVYGDRGRPELRVITCGGGFSAADGYAGNVVVFAGLVGVR